MNGFENNKYAKKMSEYLTNIEGSSKDKKYYRNLIYKANKLRTNKSIDLVNIFNTEKTLDYVKTFKKVEKLLLEGADINFATNGFGITAYMMASLNGHHEFLDYLKGKGADVLKQNTIGQNALMITLVRKSTAYDHEEKVKYLHTIKKLRDHRLNACLYTDSLGTTLNDYYLEQFGPLENFYKSLLFKFTDISKHYIQENEISF